MENDQIAAVNCPGWPRCAAPICPLTQDDSVWYRDEPICNARKFQLAHVVKLQKALAKYPGSDCFSRYMLQAMCWTSGVTKGLPEYHQNRSAEKQWIKDLKDQRIKTRASAAKKPFPTVKIG